MEYNTRNDRGDVIIDHADFMKILMSMIVTVWVKKYTP